MQPEIRLNEGGPGSLTTTGRVRAASSEWSALLSGVRSSEWVLIGFFFYTALLSVRLGTAPWHRLACFVAPLLVLALALVAEASGRLAADIARDWAPAPLVLLAYWQMDWFAGAQTLHSLESAWAQWDHVLLEGWGLRTAIESQGQLFPALLELAYSLLYTIPPLSLAALYLYHRRRLVDRFLFPYLLSTLTVYALLPFFPSASPRLEFPGRDLPLVTTAFRQFNLWVLSWGDIRTGVFPSGHVATALSCALSMRATLPEHRWLGRLLLVLALLITLATIYGRYHYAVDGAASIVICLAAYAFSRRIRRD